MGLRKWFLPLAAGPATGAAGLAILPLPHGPLTQLAGTAILTLPILAIGLALTRQRLPENLAETTAVCGASPLQTLLYARIRPALPGLLATLAAALLFAVAITPLLAPLAVRP